MKLQHVHPIGNLPHYLPHLTREQREKYVDAAQRRVEGHLPMAFHPEAGREEVRRYYTEHPTPHPDGYVLLEVTAEGRDAATVAIPTAAERAEYRTSDTPEHLMPTLTTAGSE